MDFVDSNGDGIPDAFENRPSIVEILNAEAVSAADDTAIIELEKTPRAPCKGEYFIMSAEMHHAEFNYRTLKAFVVKRVIAGNLQQPER